MTKKTFKVEGMMCQNCRKHVEKALNSLPGVTASVTLETGLAEVEMTDKEYTREELQQFAPDLYALLAEYFPNTKLQISKHKKVNEIGKY